MEHVTRTANWWREGGTICNWRDLARFEEEFSHSLKEEWVFRGQHRASDTLSPSLERAFKNLDIRLEHSAIEREMIVEFKRHYHLYTATAPPHEDDTLAYVALMRHYGAPTRLLDFTFSIFIAAYFAIESATCTPDEGAEPAAIWAVNKTWLTEVAQGIIKRSLDGGNLLKELDARKGLAFETIYLKNHAGTPFVGPVGPAFMNDRQGVQQGSFLCPTDLKMAFDSIMKGMPGSHENVRQIKVAASAVRELLNKLQRVNISRASLFPGLVGFTESLRTKLLLFERMVNMKNEGGRIGNGIPLV